VYKLAAHHSKIITANYMIHYPAWMHICYPLSLFI